MGCGRHRELRLEQPRERAQGTQDARMGAAGRRRARGYRGGKLSRGASPRVTAPERIAEVTMSGTMRTAVYADIPRMVELRASVHENRLGDPTRVTLADYKWFIDNAA